MDFHRLVRKELQSLCKLNKIPANRTNVAMAEALSSLKTVKGIEKYCKSSESSVAESSVESPEKNVVTSPKTTRTGRRKQVREGSGVVQTVAPFTRRRIRSPVASVKTVQRVYNTRLSARLLKKESMESEKKECVEAVKISSYCDVVSDNDFGEVFEGKNVSGSDNVGLELPVSEIEQEEWKVADKDLDSRDKAAANFESKVPESEIEQEEWKVADKDLDSRDKAAANFESKVPENNGLQVDTIEAILEMPSDDNMAVKENPLHNDKGSVTLSKSGDCLTLSDDVGVDVCLSKTNILTEVLAHEGSFDVGVEFPVFKIEQEIESLKGEDAYKDLDSRDTAVTTMKQVLENNALQVDIVEAVLVMPSNDNMVVIDKPIHDKKDDVGVDLCISKTDISTEVLAHEGGFFFAHEGSADMGVDLPVSEIVQECVSLKWNGADKDLGLSDTQNMKSEVLENSGLQVGTMLESVLEKPSDDNKVVIDKLLYHEKDDGGVNLCLCKTDFSAEVLAHEGSVYVGVESPVAEIEQECESLKGNGAEKDLDLSDAGMTNMNSKELENNGLQVDAMLESVLEMPSDDNMVVIDEPLHNKKDDGFDLCLCKTDVSTEVLAHGVKVFQMNTDNSLVETPTNEKKAAIPSICQQEGSVDVGFSFLEKEFQSESPKGVYGESLDAQVTAWTDLKVLVLNGKGSCNVGVDSPVSDIEVKSESLNLKSADKDLDLRDATATKMKSEVLENSGLQVDTVETVLEMPSNDNMAVVDPALNNKDCLTWSDDVEVDLNMSKTDVSIEVLANDVEGFQVVPLKPLAEMPSHDNKAVVDMPYHKKKDDVVVDIPLSEIDMTTEVLAHEVELLTIDTKKAVVEMPIHETKAVEQVFSPQKNGSDNVGVHFTFLEGSDNVGVQFSFLETDENVDAAVTRSTESESLKEQLKMESCEKVNYGELVQDLMIQPKSEKIVHKCWSSAANSFGDGENLNISVKFQQDKSCKKESGCVYDNEKGLASQDEVTGKAIASDLSICSESYERTENSIHIGDYDSPDTDFFQQNVSSKQSDSKRKLVSEILSCHNDVEFVDQSVMPGSVEFSDEFSGGETFVDESDDEDALDDDPESGSEAFDDTFDFLESMQQDRKRESIASHVLCGSYTKEPADQSDTPDSFDSSVGFSGKVASYHQLVSGNSLTKESRLCQRVASEVSYCCSGIKKLNFDESQQTSEVKSLYFSKQSGQICPSSVPSVLPSRKAKITGSEPPLILADYPFTQKIWSSGVRLLEPTFKLKSNVSNDKENMEQSENKVEVTEEKRLRDKNEFPVCKKSDLGLNVRSPR